MYNVFHLTFMRLSDAFIQNEAREKELKIKLH